jgi:glycosyltransferase involved in cell wall biosynthesis
MPDVLVFSALMPKLFGAKVILDLHDPMPELMLTIFGLGEDSSSVQLLKGLEKLSIRVADAVLTTNEAFRNLFLARGCPPDKIGVVMNSPDEKIFRYREVPSGEVSSTRDPGRPFVIMYHGSLVERHGLDLAVSALGKIRDTISEAELWVYGRATPFLERVMESVKKSSLAPAVRYLGPAKLEKIAEAIRKCDVGIIPNQRSKFTELNMPTRIFEFLSQGKPVISPRAEGILDYFGSDELVLFELGSAEDLAAKLQFVYFNPILVAEMVERGQKVYKAHRWDGEQLRLIDRVVHLLTS